MKIVAKVISVMSHPLITIPLIILTVIQLNVIRVSFKSMGILLFLSIIPTILWIFIKTKNGSYTNFSVSNQKQRTSLYVFVIVSLLATIFVMRLTEQVDYLYSGVFYGLLMLVISFLINYFIKSSLHVSLNSYIAISLYLISPVVSIAYLIFTCIVAWSRLTLKKHSLKEVLMGLSLGILFGIMFLKQVGFEIKDKQLIQLVEFHRL